MPQKVDLPKQQDFDRAIKLFNEKRFAECEQQSRELCEKYPDDGTAFRFLGTALNAQGRHAEALPPLQEAARVSPNDADVQFVLGIVCGSLQRWADAEACYRKALSLRPRFESAMGNLGFVLAQLDRRDEAKECCRRALELNSNNAVTHNVLGGLFLADFQFADAENSFRRAVQLQPGLGAAHSNLGNALRGQGKLLEAEVCYRQAVQLLSTSAEAHNNLGIILTELQRLPDAEAAYRRALQLTPNYAGAQKNLGNAIAKQGRYQEADMCYRQALRLQPDFTDAYSSLLFNLTQMSERTPEDYLEEAKRFGAVVQQRVGSRARQWRCDGAPTALRIGLVSGDFFNHPVGYFLEALLTQIDSERLQLFAYSSHHKEDDLTARIRPRFAKWQSLLGKSDPEAAQLIYGDGIHVLLDLSGHTARNRLPMFAFKPAPVQATWMGYFASTGVAEIDYILGDPYVTPEHEEHHFTENVRRLPHTYIPFTAPNIDVEVNSLPSSNGEPITFGCFNSLAKMNDDVVTVWSRILHAVPGSRLLLKTLQLSDSIMCDRTRARFGVHGIAPDRLLLEGASPRRELLATYHRVDIALDPFPYPGGTTSVESLWMGVPFVTLKGDRFNAHMGERIARNAGVSEWIAADRDDYVARAKTAAEDLSTLAKLRARLRAQLLASPLFDNRTFARHFEEAMWEMWRRFRSQPK